MRASAMVLAVVLLLSRAEAAPGEQEFDAAAKKYREGFRSLIKSRGASPSLNPASDVSWRILAAVLRGFFPARTSLLFYDRYDDDGGGGGQLQVWLLDGEGIRAYHRRALDGEQLGAMIGRLRRSLGVDEAQRTRAPRRRGVDMGPAGPPVGPAERERAIVELSATLVPPPVAAALRTTEHLILVPVRELGSVPFALLRLDGGAALVEKMTVAVAPSLFELGQLTERWEPRFATPLVVGNPLLPPTKDWVFPSLPGAEQEARAVAKRLRAVPLLGEAATRTTVRQRAQDADLLYLATHGVASSDEPMTGSFLALAAPADPEGRWTAREILGEKLRARLAVLSACQTGLGKALDAGIIGLARSFQLAGVPRVVMSLWSVSDSATAELMLLFLDRLARDPPDEALRQAMLELRRRRPDPAEWASFVLFGTPAEVAPGARASLDVRPRASFPYQLALRNLATGQLQQGGEMRLGQRYRLLLRTVDDAAPAPTRERHLYVVALDGAGAGRLIARTVTTAGAREISLAEFTASPPLGVDSFALISAAAPLKEEGLLFQRVRSLAGILSEAAQRLRSDDWTVDVLSVRSVR